jgi:hypothetical protein
MSWKRVLTYSVVMLFAQWVVPWAVIFLLMGVGIVPPDFPGSDWAYDAPLFLVWVLILRRLARTQKHRPLAHVIAVAVAAWLVNLFQHLYWFSSGPTSGMLHELILTPIAATVAYRLRDLSIGPVKALVAEAGDERGTTKERASAILLVGSAMLGFALWGLSPILTGHREPWDAEFPYYIPGMLMGGAVLGAAFPWRLGPCFVGAWIGQCVAVIVLPSLGASWLILGFITTAAGSLVAVVGAVIGALIRFSISRLRTRLGS